MFLKPFRIKTQSALKNSDRKKLRSDVIFQYPNLSAEDVSNLIPNKEEMSVTKVSTSGGEIVLIYFVVKKPIVFESYKKIYPTVYALWQFPEMVYRFRTWPAVLGNMQKGADLMLPGVAYDKKKEHPKMFSAVKKGDVVCVSLAGNSSPVAFGHALLSGEDMYMSAMRGKGVSILHVMGDSLWEAGDKSPIPNVYEPIPNAKEGENPSGEDETAEGGATVDMPNMESLQVGDETSQQAEAASNGNEEDDEEEEEDEEEKDPVAEMDELLHFCFACAIKSRIKTNDLPLLTVNLMRDFMQPFSPAKRLDVKKSSFKRLSKFLQQKVSEGYITTKEQTKGVDTITSIDKTHPGLGDLDVPEAVEEEASNDAAASSSSSEEDINKPLTFTDVYCVNAATINLFKVAELRKGDALSIADVRHIVTNYISENNLQHVDNPKIVTLDPTIAHMILRAVEGDLDHMPFEQVVNRVLGKMQPGVAISTSEGLQTIKKGKIEPIKLDVCTRASNKKVTTVENLEEFGFDMKAFARSVQRAVACSCTLVTTEQKNKGPHVQVQGNQIRFIGNMLLEKCKIPRKYVVGLDKAPKQKKR